MAPAVTGVLETCLYVDDMMRARAFYDGVMGLPVMVADERLTVYDAGPASTLILFLRGATTAPVTMAGGTIPPHDGRGPLHLALAVPAGSLDDWRRHLAARNVPIEGEMTWGGGGSSIYFRDPDAHLIELATPGLWKNYPAAPEAAASPS